MMTENNNTKAGDRHRGTKERQIPTTSISPWQRYKRNQRRDQNYRGYQFNGNNNVNYGKPPPQEQKGQEQQKDENEDVICWRCHQKGHLRIRCRVRLGHNKKALNEKRLT